MHAVTYCVFFQAEDGIRDIGVTGVQTCALPISSRPPGWVVSAGQSRTVTRPPVTSAAARKGAALDRSGSSTSSRAATGPGGTRQPRSVRTTSTPRSRSDSTVISTCGIDGTPPARARSTPSSKRAPASSSPETICEDSLASTVTAPPRTRPVPCTVNGARPQGTSEIAVIALGGIVVSASVRVGGNRFDESIANYIRKKYNLMVGERTAEEVKIAIWTALPLERELHMEV